ncbi:MAG: DUF4843 domain-containing protein [Dysgonamonadaceae bacterium]|jgi:hypothetical protein|nr:DUF4843 domain-containing protein [Dysgonamonadaceae bacterium]
MKYKILFFLALLAISVSSCNEAELVMFGDTSYGDNDDATRVFFSYTLETNSQQPPGSNYTGLFLDPRADSLSFNLASWRSQSERIGIPIRIMGNLSDTDRPVSFELVDDTLSMLNKEIELLPSFIRAGQVRDTLWVRINSTERMREGGASRPMKIDVRLIENDYFDTDFTQVVGGGRERDSMNAVHFKLRLTDNLGIPNLWAIPQVSLVFGPFSVVKYELMMRLCGFDDNFLRFFPPETQAQAIARTGIGDLTFMYGRIVNRYLRQYIENNAHKPEDEREMRDENGQPVRMGSMGANLD